MIERGVLHILPFVFHKKIPAILDVNAYMTSPVSHLMNTIRAEAQLAIIVHYE